MFNRQYASGCSTGNLYENTNPTWPTPQDIQGLLDVDDGDDDEPKISKWDTIFMLSSAIALFVDPLFNYMLVMDPKVPCYHSEQKLYKTYQALRWTTDVFYYMDIYFPLRRKYHASDPKSKTFWVFLKERATPVSFKDKKLFWKYVLEHLSDLCRIYIALPLPQIWLPLEEWNAWSKFIYISYLIQYVLRVYSFLYLIQRLPNIETRMGIIFKALLDFLPFVLFAHLYGSLWYDMSFNKALDCWGSSSVCNDGGCGREPDDWFQCHRYEDGRFNDTHLRDEVHELCHEDPTNSTIFDYGIYVNAVQTRMISTEGDLKPKILQCFWWGLRNMSSIGSNLQTSFDPLEILFSVLVATTGMLLFLIYLNSRVQVFKKRAQIFKLKRKMKMMNPEIELWLSKNGLPMDLKKMIAKHVRRKLEEKVQKGDIVDEQNLNFLQILPIIKRRQVLRLLHLSSLRRVPILENMNARVLEEMCKYLEPVTYEKNCYIIREGDPIWNMLFIKQGTALTYRSSTNVGESSRSETSIIKCLEKGDYFGKELLHWALEISSISKLPVSRSNVLSQTKVEAFAINAIHLREVVSRFRLHFSLNQACQPDLEEATNSLESVATSSLQAAWLERANRSTGWNRISELVKRE